MYVSHTLATNEISMLKCCFLPIKVDKNARNIIITLHNGVVENAVIGPATL